MSDPEKIIHKRVWKERNSARAKNPEYSVEDYPPSSSQGVRTENPQFYLETPRRGSTGIEGEDSHPTLETEEIKEVTEVVAVNHELFPATPQSSISYFPIVIHTLLPPTPLPSSVSQTVAQPPPPPMANVPAFLLNKYAPLALPQILNDMPQHYLKILPRFTGENEVDAQKHLETFCSFAENLNVEHLDVVLRLFV